MTRSTSLFDRFSEQLPKGRVEWIGVRPERKHPMVIVESAKAIAGLGLAGDRRLFGRPDSARQITFISAEHIEVVEKLLKRAINPALLRRNVVISGINIHALRHQQFQIGEAVFEATALCHPCSRMDKNLGPGGHMAMLGHGGLCARILREGIIRVGDELTGLAVSERLLPISGHEDLFD